MSSTLIALGQTLSLFIVAVLSLPVLLLDVCICRTRAAPPAPTSALITGATGGLGEELAIQLAQRHGARLALALTGRDVAALERTADLCRAAGARVRTLRADVVLDRDALRTFILETDAIAPLDLVLANAGVTERTARIAEDDIEGGARATFAVNVDGVFNTVFPALGPMRKRRIGQVCVISSIASYNPFSLFDGYSASKSAVRVWAEGLRHKLFREGVRVSVATPGYLSGHMTTAFGSSVDLRGMVSQKTAAQRVIVGLERDEALIAFPSSTFLLSTALAALPFHVRDLLARTGLVAELRYA